MTSALAASSVLLGEQRPRLLSLPHDGDDESEGCDAVELARQAGLLLDDWQRFVLRKALRKRRNGKWSAFEVCLILARQNGKGSVLEALELAALFLFDDVRLILHSAHKFDTAADAFRRILGLIEANPDFASEVAKVIRSHGSESIELKNGKRLRFIARSSGAGRGFAADLVILDEAYDISDDAMASMLPTLSTRPNPQVWYTSTAGGQMSVQLARVRERGLRGDDSSLAFFEWSADPDAYNAADPGCWAQANPGLDIRISRDYIELEHAALTAEAFARERLSVGDYPAPGNAWLVLPRAWWEATTMTAEQREHRPARRVFAIDTTPDRAWTAAAMAGERPGGKIQLELAEHLPGTKWVVPWAVERDAMWRPECWVVDQRAQAGSLVTDLEDAGLTVVALPGPEVAHACAGLYDAYRDEVLVHDGHPDVAVALAGGHWRAQGETRVFDRRKPGRGGGPLLDLSPLYAFALACHGWRRHAADYDARRSVGFDVAELVRLYRMGVYGAGDVERCWARGLIDDAGVAALAAAGIPVPAGAR
jgi:hypothetical protein